MRARISSSLLVLTLVLGATAARAASATAQCNQDCGRAKRACIGGSKALLQSAAGDCRNAVSAPVRKACMRQARARFTQFKQSCAAQQRTCRSCCRGGNAGAACTGNGSPVDGSSLCPQLHGGLAAYWDWLNGVFHPLAQIPTAGGFWVPYQHPGYPLLGFRYPPDWTPQTIAAEQTVGVNLIRNDGAAVWRYLGTWGDVGPGVRVLRDVEVSTALDYLGNPGGVQTVCVNEGQASLAPGVTAAGSNIIVQTGGFTVIVVATTTTLDGLSGGQILFNTSIAPTAEIDRLSFDTFLPIHFQLFVGRSTQDSDLDGVPDGQDNFPDDPTRS